MKLEGGKLKRRPEILVVSSGPQERVVVTAISPRTMGAWDSLDLIHFQVQDTGGTWKMLVEWMSEWVSEWVNEIVPFLSAWGSQRRELLKAWRPSGLRNKDLVNWPSRLGSGHVSAMLRTHCDFHYSWNFGCQRPGPRGHGWAGQIFPVLHLEWEGWDTLANWNTKTGLKVEWWVDVLMVIFA